MSAALALPLPIVGTVRDRLTVSLRLQRIRDEITALLKAANDARDDATTMVRGDDESSTCDDLDSLIAYLGNAEEEIGNVESVLKRVVL